MGNPENFEPTAVSEKENEDMELSRVYELIAEKKQAEEGDENEEESMAFLKTELPSVVVDDIEEKITRRKGQHERIIDKIEQNVDEDTLGVLKEGHGEILRDVTEDATKNAFAQSWDRRFKISTDEYLMNKLIDEVEERIDKKESPEVLNKIVVMFFDIDGLKSVNDNVSHEAGDKYLQKVCDFFYGCNTVSWLEQQGIEVEPSHRSGDEFIVSLSAESDISTPGTFKGTEGEDINDTPLAEYAMKELKKELHSLDMDDIQNFSDQSIRGAYRDDLLKDGIKLPKDFKYRASMSGGWASLSDAIKELNLEPSQIEGMSFKEIKKKIVNKVFALSDTRMEKNKMNNKKDRANSENLDEKILQIIYDANRTKQRSDD